MKGVLNEGTKRTLIKEGMACNPEPSDDVKLERAEARQDNPWKMISHDGGKR